MPPEILAFITQNPVCTLATAQVDQPHVRGFLSNIIGGKLYFTSSTAKAVGRQLRANPKVELCYLSQDFATMLRIRAHMKAVDDRAIKQQLIETREYLAHFSADDPSFMLLSPINGEAWFWTLADNLREAAIERVPFQPES
ncbi:pyridoxamine 5'-phosphate oxidase family protein [Sulfurimonas sp. HSL-3221]|uniref:pyridoxamine 5'-phosphate oxidase family protein n=1 Tax=Sulfurimonadaceae TaxID=2771471 RepID=UPI001E378762|nr:pyridoxamine 5'-phosphate oxidase family protein [Sulfurimonas sp. HSL-3221]UFS61672.1 pyridoxamine 5'-phosphate oxidase family protein [Sulfurimonas sp. HSL-3221]